MIKTDLWIAGISSFIVFVCFGLAHWLYAYKYWIFSILVPAVMAKQSCKSDLKCAQITNAVIIANIVGWQAVSLVIFLYWTLNDLYYTEFVNKTYIITMWSTVPFNLLSCLVLGWAYYKLFKLTKCDQKFIVHGKMMVAHLLTYLLSVFCLIEFLLSTMGRKTKEFTNSMVYLFLLLNLVG